LAALTLDTITSWAWAWSRQTGSPPDPIPRPGVTPPDEVAFAGDVMTLDEMDAWLAERRAPDE